MWVDDEIVEAGRGAGVSIDGRAPAEFLPELERHRPKPRLDQIADLVLEEARKVFEHEKDDEKRLTKLRNRVANNGRLKRLAR